MIFTRPHRAQFPVKTRRDLIVTTIGVVALILAIILFVYVRGA